MSLKLSSIPVRDFAIDQRTQITKIQKAAAMGKRMLEAIKGFSFELGVRKLRCHKLYVFGFASEVLWVDRFVNARTTSNGGDSG